MHEALNLLKTRRSVKPVELQGPAPTVTELETLLTVASRVPDHGKLVPWRFIVFDGEARLAAGEKIAAAWEKALEIEPDNKAAHMYLRMARGTPSGQTPA